MVKLIITHKVKNFPELMEVCIAGEPLHRQAGIMSVSRAKRLV